MQVTMAGIPSTIEREGERELYLCCRGVVTPLDVELEGGKDGGG